VKLEELVPLDDVVTCLPIIQEVLQGFRDERAWRTAHAAMFALPRLESPLQREVFEQAVDLYRAARRKGLTVRSGVDCLIAACALRASVPVLHRDRDFEALAQVSPLAVRSI
jgi:predicted nucleic acid-binding protein